MNKSELSVQIFSDFCSRIGYDWCILLSRSELVPVKGICWLIELLPFSVINMSNNSHKMKFSGDQGNRKHRFVVLLLQMEIIQRSVFTIQPQTIWLGQTRKGGLVSSRSQAMYWVSLKFDMILNNFSTVYSRMSDSQYIKSLDTGARPGVLCWGWLGLGLFCCLALAILTIRGLATP